MFIQICISIINARQPRQHRSKQQQTPKRRQYSRERGGLNSFRSFLYSTYSVYYKEKCGCEEKSIIFGKKESENQSDVLTSQSHLIKQPFYVETTRTITWPPKKRRLDTEPWWNLLDLFLQFLLLQRIFPSWTTEWPFLKHCLKCKSCFDR